MWKALKLWKRMWECHRSKDHFIIFHATFANLCHVTGDKDSVDLDLIWNDMGSCEAGYCNYLVVVTEHFFFGPSHPVWQLGKTSIFIMSVNLLHVRYYGYFHNSFCLKGSSYIKAKPRDVMGHASQSVSLHSIIVKLLTHLH